MLPSIVSPFGVYLSRIYAASSMPDELLEAARIDGASEFRAFTTAPYLMRPAGREMLHVRRRPSKWISREEAPTYTRYSPLAISQPSVATFQ